MAPGVTETNSVEGLTGEEATEIALLSGRCGKLRLMDLTEFNPRIEDYKTGRLATSILYYFLLGLHERI
jgi:formiminoglutamase